MNTKRIVLLGGIVTMSLLADVPVASAATSSPNASIAAASSPNASMAATSSPNVPMAAAMDPWRAGWGGRRPAWLVRPRPLDQRVSIA